jgi:hypothetical protein
LKEVFPEITRQIGLRRRVEKDSAELLTRAEDFATSMQGPAGICRGQVEELECAIESPLEAIMPPLCVCPNRSVDLAADVRELLY